jgi:xanthine/CO dehydrogenase XdhC/CoxF family maturation factor
VIESDTEDLPPGATVIRHENGVGVTGMHSDAAARLLAQEPDTAPAIASVAIDAGSATVLFADVWPPPRLLLLGAGMDVEPVVRFACELGWRCTVVDHRDAYVEHGEFAGAEKVMCLPADELAVEFDLSKFDAAVVMSHHLASDRTYLRQIAAADIDYVGLLGPAKRRERLVSDLGDDGAGLAERLHGPAGLDIGGRGPGAIALSIIAEVQSVLRRA